MPQQSNNSQARCVVPKIVHVFTCETHTLHARHPALQLLDELSTSVSHGLSRLTVAASSVASATVATVKPGLQEVSQRYQRGELAESAASLVATGADLGMKGLSNLKGLLRTAVSQIDAYAGGSALGPNGPSGPSGDLQHPPQAWQPRGEQFPGASGTQHQRAPQSNSAGWNGWDDQPDGDQQHKPQDAAQGSASSGAVSKDKWAGWDNAGGIPDDVWDADWGK